jgi:hypothetical protein
LASYTVKTGDSLSAIAKRNGTTVAELLRLNPKLTSDPKYKDGKVIFNGTKITLPGAAGTTATPPPVSTPVPTVDTTPAEQPVGTVTTFIDRITPVDAIQSTQTTQALPPVGTVQTVTPTAEVPIPTLQAPVVFQPTEMPTLPPVAEQPTQTQTLPGVTAVTQDSDVTYQWLVDPFTGQQVLDAQGNPIKVKMGGGADAYYDYLAGVKKSRTNLEAAGAANKLAIERAAAAGEFATGKAEKELYSSQQRALNELSRRGLSGAPGLTRAAKRAYGAAPLSQRLEAIRKMQGDITAANLLLAQQKSAEQAAEEQRQFDLTKATGIANQLGGSK